MDALAALLVLLALRAAWRTVSGLEWPADPDHWRDIAHAQTVLDGHPWSDPNYAGEWTWYNPLLAWTLALTSRLARVELPSWHVQAGPFLNLGGAVGFYLLCRRMVGSAAAVISLCAYLTLTANTEAFPLTITYSPWLFPTLFAQGFFFAFLFVLAGADRPSSVRTPLLGLLLGLTFLGHTAPALVAGCVMVVRLRRRPRALITSLLVALIIALPLLVPIAVHYKLRILNRAPTDWVYPPVTATGLPSLLRQYGWLVALGAWGLVTARNLILWTWLGCCLVFLAWGVLPIPHVVPAFHFWLYGSAALLAAMGHGCFGIVGRRPVVVWALACTAGVVLLRADARADYVLGREAALARDPDLARATRYIRANYPPETVMLGTYGVSALVIAPAGRKVVAGIDMLSNPYVAYSGRARLRDELLETMAASDRAALLTGATRAGISAIVEYGPVECDALGRMIPLRWRRGAICVADVPSAGAGG